MSSTTSRLRVSLMLLILLAILVGLPLHTSFNDQFFSVYTLPAMVVAPLLIGFVGLLMSTSIFLADLRRRFPTAWVRVLVWPAFVLILAAFLYMSVSGWIAATSRLFAHEPATIELDVLNVDRHETKQAICLQRIQVRYRERESRWCADPFVTQGEIRAGTRLQASGWSSPLGFHLEALRTQ